MFLCRIRSLGTGLRSWECLGGAGGNLDRLEFERCKRLCTRPGTEDQEQADNKTSAENKELVGKENTLDGGSGDEGEAEEWSEKTLEKLRQCVRVAEAYKLNADLVPPSPSTTESSKTPLQSKDVNKSVLYLTHKSMKNWRQNDVQKVEAAMKLKQSLDAIHALIKKKKRALDSVNISSALHRLASLASNSGVGEAIVKHPVLSDLLGLVMRDIEKFKANQVANTLWSMGKLGYRCRNVGVDGNKKGVDVVYQLILRSVQVVGDFTPIGICQVLYGLVHMGVQVESRDYTPLLAAVAKQQLNNFNMQSLTVLMVSLAKLEYEDHIRLLPAVCDRFEEKIDWFEKTQQLSNITWALARLEYGDASSLLHAISTKAALKISDFFIVEFANLFWGFSKLKFHPGDKFLELTQTLLRRARKYANPKTLSMIFIALADFGDGSMKGVLVDDLLDTAIQSEGVFEPQQLTNIAWALAILNRPEIRALHWLVAKLKQWNFKLNELQKRQFFQFLFTLQVAHPDINLSDIMPEGVELDCRECWKSAQKLSKTPIVMHDVLATFTAMGYECGDRLVGEGVLSASTVVDESMDLKVAIEVDIPFRFFKNNRKRLVNRYVWRERVLEASGWSVLRIRSEQWESLGHRDLKRNFLSAQLKAFQDEAVDAVSNV